MKLGTTLKNLLGKNCEKTIEDIVWVNVYNHLYDSVLSIDVLIETTVNPLDWELAADWFWDGNWSDNRFAIEMLCKKFN